MLLSRIENRGRSMSKSSPRVQNRSRGRSKSRDGTKDTRKFCPCGKEGNIWKFCRLFKKGQNGKNNQKKETEKNATTTIFESNEIVVLSFENEECNYVVVDDAK